MSVNDFMDLGYQGLLFKCCFDGAMVFGAHSSSKKIKQIPPAQDGSTVRQCENIICVCDEKIFFVVEGIIKATNYD